MNRTSLVRALSTAGQEPLELATEGAALVALPHGARVLGLFSGDNPNFLWAHPNLYDPKTATEFFLTPGWKNTGGDRIWISPERDLNVRDLTNPWGSYEFPESIDPGTHTVELDRAEISFRTRAWITHRRLGRNCQIDLNKRVRLIPHPLRADPSARQILTAACYAGYEQVTCLSYADPDSDFQPPLSIWEAVNLPAPGQIIIPTVRTTRAKDFFEPSGSSHLIHSENGIRFVLDAQERHKIAVRVTDLLGGRAGYYRRLNRDECTLIVRNFAIDPSGEYIDTPWDNPEDRGYVLECYNDSGLNGDYGELEYHSPAMGAGTARTECLDRAQLWGFQGLPEIITEIMRRLLGNSVTTELCQHNALWNP